MFRFPLRPSPLGFALGLVVVVFWALLWAAVLAVTLPRPQTTARQAGQLPALARVNWELAVRARA